MPDLDLIREHMEIVGSDGQHVAVALRAEGDGLLLVTGDPRIAALRLPLTLVDTIEAVIRLNAPALDVINAYLRDHPAAIDSPPPTG